jgi:hypothetical protein
MQAIYKSDGTITKVYDASLHSHASLMTVDLTTEQAENIGLYQVNPNTVELYLVPTVAEKYQKTINNVILEMTQEEKDFIDLPHYYKKLIGDEWVAMTATEKTEVLAANVREQRNRLLADSDFSQLPDAPVNRDEWATYRQALRDLPANTADVFNPVYPEKPE